MYAMYKKVELPSNNELAGTGWLPPMPGLLILFGRIR